MSTVDAATRIAAPPITRYGVTLLTWPAEEPTRKVLAARRIPRLLLIAADCAPPIVTDSLEDWMRDPIDSADLEARTRALAHRAGATNDARPAPAMDGEGDHEQPVEDRSSWVVDEADIQRLLGASNGVAAAASHEVPCLDEDSGVLRFGHRWIVVSARQVPVASLLLEHFGTVVGRSELEAAYADVDGSTDPAAFKSMTLRLGHRLAQIGLALRAVRGRGYVLEHAADMAPPPSPIAAP